MFIATVAMFGALGGAQAKYEQGSMVSVRQNLFAPGPIEPQLRVVNLQQRLRRTLPLQSPSEPQLRVVNLQKHLSPIEPKPHDDSKLESQASDPSKFGILGSVEFKVAKHKFSADWANVRQRIESEKALYEFCTGAESMLCPEKVGRWRKKLAELKGQSKLDQLKKLNRFVNHLVSYADDTKTFGKKDHWANPVQLLQTSGDCEDYAILKFYSLLELGFTNEQMRLAIVRDRKRGVLHAIVSVELEGKTYILDSLFDRAVSHQYILKYVPVYSWNLQDQWAHIVTKKIRIKFVEYMAKLA